MPNSKASYEERLRIPVEGRADEIFLTSSGTIVARGYTRIVIGDRGPYVEFLERHLNWPVIFVPEDQKWRLEPNARCYYVELRSDDEAFVKIYYQLSEVKYADYKVGFFYISPFDLTLDSGVKLIDKVN